MLYFQILLVIVSTVRLELRNHPNLMTAVFEHANLMSSGDCGAQQSVDADSAQRHYQAGLSALEKNDLAAAEDEMQAAAKLAPKDAKICYKLGEIQAKREEWRAALKSLDAARALGLPKELDDEAVKLSADIITKQLQANMAESKKKEGWLIQLSWLEGRHFFSKTFSRDSECAKDYHSIYNVLDLKKDHRKSLLLGTLTLRETHRILATGASGCPDTPPESKSLPESGAKLPDLPFNQEFYRDAVLQVVIKPDDGINDSKIRMFATLESCKGNACDTLEHEVKAGTATYIVEESNGSPVISISVLSDGDKDGRLDELFREQILNRS